ncbi:MAG TPA: glycosyltransferase family 9 protein [Chthoniobacterales bacterium]|nr:glycosyltransferase family 9 protein [Chthoniobacterales bacterium]
MQRILVIRGGAIGDFVLTLPAIKLLRDNFPDSHIEILGYKQIVALAERRFYADATRSIEYAGLASFFAKGAALPSELADYFASFDLIVSYLFDCDKIFETNLRRCGVETLLVGSPKISGDDHAATQLARPLEELGLSLQSPSARIFPSAADREFARSLLELSATPMFALHPGSGSATKNWPLTSWRSLGEQLLASGTARSLLAVGGEADRDGLAALKELRDGRVQFAENLPLPHLAALLERCAMFIGHDSGISHIAAAVGTSSVLLFGPSDPDIWAPRNTNVRILRAASGNVRDLAVTTVTSAVRALC